MFSFIYTALKTGPKFFFQRGSIANTGKYFKISIIVNGVLHNVVHGLYQGCLYLQRIIHFHGTNVTVIPLELLRKVRVIPTLS
jgi:hypothetical protein